jgi:hypothetical protein
MWCCQPYVFVRGRAYKLFNISIKVGIGAKFYDVFGDVAATCGKKLFLEDTSTHNAEHGSRN